MSTVLRLAVALTLLAGAASAQPYYRNHDGRYHHHPHPPPITCNPPKVAKVVFIGPYHNRHEWRCVKPGHG